MRHEKVSLARTAHDYTLASGDPNGNGTAEFTIKIKGLINLTAGDFLL